jgi:VIT1/CCC1 family predicted Fe2+/Mn2+ transporter
MLSIVLSTIAFFLSAYYLKGYLENMGVPKSMTRGALIFSIALLISYVVAVVADYLPH